MSEWGERGQTLGSNDPPPTRGPAEGTKHLRRIADQVIPWRVAPQQSPPPLHLASPAYRTEPSDIAVIPQKTFPEYPRAATQLAEEPYFLGRQHARLTRLHRNFPADVLLVYLCIKIG